MWTKPEAAPKPLPCPEGQLAFWKDESGIHLINLPPVSYVFQAGEPAGWAHATLEREGMQLELRCVDPAHKSHGQLHKLQWRAG